MRKLGNFFYGVGILLLAAAFMLTLYNIHTDNHAKASASEVLEALDTFSEAGSSKTVAKNADKNDSFSELPDTPAECSTQETVIPDYKLNPDMKMPIQTVNGQEYIGVLTLEELSLELPVMSDWDYPKLKESPCRYHGTAYQDNFVIMAHNFQSHFGQIRNLSVGSRVTFKDIDNNCFSYQVVQIETLGPTEVDTVKSGIWDLTLFTCTIGGEYRIVVRCNKL